MCVAARGTADDVHIVRIVVIVLIVDEVARELTLTSLLA